MQTDININENPATHAEDGHDARGRFKPGNPGGPGNPLGGRASFLRQAVLECVTKEDIQGIVKRLVTMAQEGHWQAAKLILTTIFGKSQSMATQLDDLIMAMPSESAPMPPDTPPPSPNGEIQETQASPNLENPKAPPSPNGDFQEAPPSPNGECKPTLNRKQRRAERKARRLAFKAKG